jgi:DNA adenine methylase
MMERVRAAARYGSDADPHIVSLLKAVQAGWEPPREVTEAEHAFWKEQHARGSTDPMVAFVGFGCSFGGHFFAGYARDTRGRTVTGEFASEARRTLLLQKPRLAGVDMRVADYRDLWMGRWPEVTYCDPPYQGTTAVGDCRSPMNGFDHDAFWRWCEGAKKKTCLLVSEYACPLRGAVVLWERTSSTGMRYADGSAKKTERLFALSRFVTARVGLGGFP